MSEKSNGERVELWKGGPVFTQAEHFRLGTDSVLLADFVNIGGRRNGIDLGTGSGILPLLLCTADSRLHMTGLEINPAAALTARMNMQDNGLSSRCTVIEGDIRRCRSIFASGEFDLVVTNPPYFSAGSGMTSPCAERAEARGELLCTLEDICRAAAYLCRTGGVFCMVHRAERLADVICMLRETGFEPKRLRTVAHSAEKEPSLVLIEARRGGNAGLKIMPTLLLNELGAESAEVKRIYHREETT